MGDKCYTLEDRLKELEFDAEWKCGGCILFKQYVEDILDYPLGEENTNG